MSGLENHYQRGRTLGLLKTSLMRKEEERAQKDKIMKEEEVKDVTKEKGAPAKLSCKILINNKHLPCQDFYGTFHQRFHQWHSMWSLHFSSFSDILCSKCVCTSRADRVLKEHLYTEHTSTVQQPFHLETVRDE